MKPSKIVADSLAMATTAFGLVAALAWNEAIKAFLIEVIPTGKGVVSLFIYALVVTIVAIIVTARLTKIKEKLESDVPDHN